MTFESKNKKPVILQILPALENGGVERGVVDIAKALKKMDFEPIVVSNGGILVYQLKEKGIKHISLKVNSKNPLVIFSNIKKIAEIISENKVDIVHVRSRAPMISALYACKQMKCKLVSTVHGIYSLNLIAKNSLLKKLYNAIMLKSDQVIAVSHFVKNYLISNYKLPLNPQPNLTSKILQKFIPQDIFDKIQVIQRGADLQYFCNQNVSKNRVADLINQWDIFERKNIILFPARFTAWKGHKFLVEALAKVKNPNFLCIMIGSDIGHQEFKQKIERQIMNKNLGNKVKMFTTCKDMPAAYNIADLVISASIKPEAFGRIAIEAGAMKKIIIATNIGGSLETIIDKETGFLVSPNDSEELAKAIDSALDLSEEQKAIMGDKARKNIEENFSHQAMTDKTIALYQSLLQ
jgi:glycosyltransferase involved in cell wall biosynthesis